MLLLSVGVPEHKMIGNLRSNISVVEPAQDWHGQGMTNGLDRARDWRVLSSDKCVRALL